MLGLAAHAPELLQAADEPAVAWLDEVIEAWNDAALRLDFPPCQSEADDEYHAGDAYSPVSVYPVDGTRICADLVLLGKEVVLRFRVDPEGSSVPLAWVIPLMPDIVVLEKEGDEGEVLRLDIVLHGTDDATLLRAWKTGLWSTMVAWAVDLPEQDTTSWYEQDDALPSHALLGDRRGLEPPISTIATLIGVAAAYVAQVHPPISKSFMIGYDEDGSVPDMEMLMAVTNVANGSDELTYILGLWLSGCSPSREGAAGCGRAKVRRSCARSCGRGRHKRSDMDLPPGLRPLAHPTSLFGSSAGSREPTRRTCTSSRRKSSRSEPEKSSPAPSRKDVA